MAFEAVWWGSQACIALVREDRPGSVVDQEFGIFESWTRAHTFAVSLNEGLGLTSADAMQILLSAAISRPDFAALPAPHASFETLSPAVLSSRLARRRLIEARLDLAFTLCEVAQSVAPSPAIPRILGKVWAALESALESGPQLTASETELDLFHRRLRELAAAATRVCQYHQLEPYPWIR